MFFTMSLENNIPFITFSHFTFLHICKQLFKFIYFPVTQFILTILRYGLCIIIHSSTIITFALTIFAHYIFITYTRIFLFFTYYISVYFFPNFLIFLLPIFLVLLLFLLFFYLIILLLPSLLSYLSIICL